MRAIALISGGLDSLLAAKVIKNQGVKVIPVKFVIPFAHLKHHSYEGKGLEEFVSLNLEEKLNFLDIGKEFLELILNPDFGFGKHMNPCIDCKILMLRKAGEIMPHYRASFVVTGEVLGQRPMSQHKKALHGIERESNLSGLLLRPLCAKLLPITIPEKEGWVARESLFNFSGRSRSSQLKLADKLNMPGLPNASGGCLLTDRKFSVRLKDLIKHNCLNRENVELLKIGRHFRVNDNLKVIVGRNEKENIQLEGNLYDGSLVLYPDKKTAGPSALVVGNIQNEELSLCARIVASYCDDKNEIIRIFYKSCGEKNARFLFVQPEEKEKFRELLI